MKRKTQYQQNLKMTPCQQIMSSSLFYQLMNDLEQFATRIPYACSIITIFSLKETFYLKKYEIRTKNL